MEYAIIRTGGKQYRVQSGDVIQVEKLEGKKNEAVTFSEVLLHVADGKMTVGKPVVKDFSVTGVVVAQEKGEKIRVSKFKAKARYRRVTGHRQQLTRVRIEKFGNEKKIVKKGTKKTKETQAAKRKNTKQKTAK